MDRDANAEVLPLQDTEPSPAYPPSDDEQTEAPVSDATDTTNVGGATSKEAAPPTDERVAAAAAPATHPPRPPVLASEVLREDLEPTEPGRGALRIVGGVIAAIAVPTSLAFGGIDPYVIAIALVLAGITGTCASPLQYAARATAVLGGVGLGLALSTLGRFGGGTSLDISLLALGTVVLSGGLVFRSRYRASRWARAIVVLGIAIVGTWLASTGGFDVLAHVHTRWQSWAPAALRVAFAMLLLLSLLAFMTSSSTGGTRIWAVVLLLAFAARLAIEQALHLPTVGLPSPLLGIDIATVALTIVGAMAFAQTLATSVPRR